MNLEKVMNDKVNLELFKIHCVEELCSENLFFKLKLREFQKIEDKKECIKAAYDIYHSFIEDYSEFELNLSVIFKKQMYAIFHNKQEDKMSSTMFHGISFDVEWMLNDSLERFQQNLKEKEEIVSKPFLSRLSTISRNTRQKRRLKNEEIRFLDDQRRNSICSKSINSPPVSNSISKPSQRKKRNSILNSVDK
eukprot:gene8604-552_t